MLPPVKDEPALLYFPYDSDKIRTFKVYLAYITECANIYVLARLILRHENLLVKRTLNMLRVEVLGIAWEM